MSIKCSGQGSINLSYCYYTISLGNSSPSLGHSQLDHYCVPEPRTATEFINWTTVYTMAYQWASSYPCSSLWKSELRNMLREGGG